MGELGEVLSPGEDEAGLPEAAVPGTPEVGEEEIREELPEFLAGTQEVFKICRAKTSIGEAFFASDPEKRFPWIYPRDASCLINGLVELGDYGTAKQCCRYLLSCQLESGQWVQRYTAEGERADAKPEQDGASLVMWSVMKYIERSGDTEFAQEVWPQIEKGLDWIEQEGRDGLEKYGLVHSQASINEAIDSRTGEYVNQGYETWNNSVTAKALEMIGRQYNNERASSLSQTIKDGISKHLILDGKIIRRLKDNEERDEAPDFISLSPMYFDVFGQDEVLDGTHTFREIAANTVEYLRANLEDHDIGGIRRFPGMDYRDEHPEYKGIVDPLLPGPWVHPTAWLAQTYAKMGERKKALELVRWIFDQAEDGRLPEHLVSKGVFAKYHQEEIDYHKSTKTGESRDRAVANVERMVGQLEADDNLAVEYVRPLLWAHIETLRVLKMLGDVDGFKVEKIE